MLTQKILTISPGDAATVRSKIKTWTGSYEDDIYAVAFQVGGWAMFSNSVFASTVNGVPVTATVWNSWDPPAEAQRADPSDQSQHTYFDGGTLKERTPTYRRVAVNFFVDYALGGYLRGRQFIVEPTEKAIAALDGRLPETEEDVVRVVCADPTAVRTLKVVESDFDPDTIAPATRSVCEALLDSPEQLDSFISDPENFIAENTPEGEDLPEAEGSALLSVAADKPELLAAALDCVELGAAKGDGNVYILIGVDPETGRPKQEWIGWALGEAEAHYDRTGSWPAYGHFPTDARLRYHVVLGPGTTDRERRYLEFFGNVIMRPPSQYAAAPQETV